MNVLKRASLLIKEIASGEISSDIIDVYPVPKTKTTIQLNNDYLKKISGKNYPAKTVKNILLRLGFEILDESTHHLIVAVPFSKPDVFLQADVIEEIMRIDGFDNIDIPAGIFISPATDHTILERAFMEKAAGYLVASGFSEIFTNSITNSAYFDDRTLKDAVKILNSLSVELDIMRPGLLQTGLECVSYNMNRKNNDLLLFEFGKSYSALADYTQSEHLCLYLSGNKNEAGWRTKRTRPDIYFVKGVCDKVFSLCGMKVNFSRGENKNGTQCINITAGGETVGNIIDVNKEQLDRFSIKQPVLFADIFWDGMMTLVKEINVEYKDIAKFPMVHRDLSIIVDKKILYSKVEEAARLAKVSRLVEIKLFDVFENEKLGKNKKSFAISLTFSDADKTLTDKETDQMISDLIKSFGKELGAQIRTAT